MATDTAEWERLLRDWSTWLRAGGRSRGTIEKREYHVRRLMSSCRKAPGGVVLEDLVALIGAPTWSLETRRSYRASFRGFFSWAHASGHIACDPSHLLPRIAPSKALPRPAPDAVILEAMRRAEDRVRLMIRLGAEAGLRRAEIAVVNERDLEHDGVGWTLVVHGKGAKDRRVPLPDGLAAALRRETMAHGGAWAFPSDRSPGPIGAIRVGELVNAALPAEWTCHKLRHRFASELYRTTRDLLLVMRILGHTKPETTLRYVAALDERERGGVEATALRVA